MWFFFIDMSYNLSNDYCSSQTRKSWRNVHRILEYILVIWLALYQYPNPYLMVYALSSFCPVFRHYFALATNPGEQFYAFTSIAAWLLQMAGKHFEQPQEVKSRLFVSRQRVKSRPFVLRQRGKVTSLCIETKR